MLICMTFELCCVLFVCFFLWVWDRGDEGNCFIWKLMEVSCTQEVLLHVCQCRMQGWYNTEWNPPPPSSLHAPAYTRMHVQPCTFPFPPYIYLSVPLSLSLSLSLSPPSLSLPLIHKHRRNRLVKRSPSTIVCTVVSLVLVARQLVRWWRSTKWIYGSLGTRAVTRSPSLDWRRTLRTAKSTSSLWPRTM